MVDPESDENNVVDLAAARRTLAKSKKKPPKNPSPTEKGFFKNKVWPFLQLMVMLVLVAWMLRKCRGG